MGGGNTNIWRSRSDLLHERLQQLGGPPAHAACVCTYTHSACKAGAWVHPPASHFSGIAGGKELSDDGLALLLEGRHAVR